MVDIVVHCITITFSVLHHASYGCDDSRSRWYNLDLVSRLEWNWIWQRNIWASRLQCHHYHLHHHLHYLDKKMIW